MSSTAVDIEHWASPSQAQVAPGPVESSYASAQAPSTDIQSSDGTTASSQAAAQDKDADNIQGTIDAIILSLATRSDEGDATTTHDAFDPFASSWMESNLPSVWVDPGSGEYGTQPSTPPSGWVDHGAGDYGTASTDLPSGWVPHGSGDYGVSTDQTDDSLGLERHGELPSAFIPPIDYFI